MNTADLFEDLHFLYGRKLRDQFALGELPRFWLKKYPQLFNEKDLSLTGQGSTYLFFEWLAAVLLYEATGYLSYHKWDCKVHKEKNTLFRKLADPEFADMIGATSGCPDLMVVAPDHSDWFLCEVKGPRDKLSAKQIKVARDVLDTTGRKVRLLHLKPIH